MTAEQAVQLISALQDLTDATGTKTNRTQNRVLQSLDDRELLRAAVQLKHQGVIAAILAGKKLSGGENANDAR